MSRARHALSAPIVIFSAPCFISCFWNKGPFVKKVVQDKDDTNGQFGGRTTTGALFPCTSKQRTLPISPFYISFREEDENNVDQGWESGLVGKALAMCKHEVSSSDPQRPCKTWVSWHLGATDRPIPEAHWLACLTHLMSQVHWETFSHKIRWKVTEEGIQHQHPSGLYIHEHVWAREHTHMQTYT